VTVRPVPGGLVIALTWGPAADWCRNVLAAGGCTMRWRGQEYTLVRPTVVDAVHGLSAFSSLEQSVLRTLGVNAFLHLSFASLTRTDDRGRTLT
jgi:hypothetical protein